MKRKFIIEEFEDGTGYRVTHEGFWSKELIYLENVPYLIKLQEAEAGAEPLK